MNPKGAKILNDVWRILVHINMFAHCNVSVNVIMFIYGYFLSFVIRRDMNQGIQ